MILKSKTNGRIITKDLKEAKNFFDQLLGLLNKNNPRSLMFNTRFGIHTFFLKEPIDVLVLNKKYQVVKIKENLNPNQLFFWSPKYYIIIELPAGTTRKFKIKPGTLLAIF